MFSRTTIASSIRIPIESDNAISVRKLIVKPNAYSAINVASTEIGIVRPVITVERHECRNRNTINTVNPAPSRIVCFTLSTPCLMNLDWSNVTCNDKSAGRVLRINSIFLRIESDASIEFAPRVLRISIEIPRSLLLVESDASSRSVSRTVAIMPSVTGDEPPAPAPRRETIMRSKSAASLNLPCTRTRRSVRCPTKNPAA